MGSDKVTWHTIFGAMIIFGPIVLILWAWSRVNEANRISQPTPQAIVEVTEVSPKEEARVLSSGCLTSEEWLQGVEELIEEDMSKADFAPIF